MSSPGSEPREPNPVGGGPHFTDSMSHSEEITNPTLNTTQVETLESPNASFLPQTDGIDQSKSSTGARLAPLAELDAPTPTTDPPSVRTKKRPPGPEELFELSNEKAKRINHACTPCRERKARCDGKRPVCSLCEKRKQDCVFSDRRYRGPSKKKLREEPSEVGVPEPESILDPSLPPNALATPQSHDLSAFRDAFFFDTAGIPFPFDDNPFDPPESYIVPSEEAEGDVLPSGENGTSFMKDESSENHPFDPSSSFDSATFAKNIPVDVFPSFFQSSESSLAEETETSSAGPVGPYLTRTVFEAVLDAYLSSLTRRNRLKALMTQAMYDEILRVLAAERFAEEVVELEQATRKHAIDGSVQSRIGEGSGISPPSPASSLPQPVTTIAPPMMSLSSGSLSGEVAEGGSSSYSPTSAASQMTGIVSSPVLPSIIPTSSTARVSQRPQFEAWALKTFTLERVGALDVVAYNGRPVAVQEQLYDILLYCHKQTNHGGRDRTTLLVNRHYSWIPKVVIEHFVRACPGCPRKMAAAKRITRAKSNPSIRPMAPLPLQYFALPYPVASASKGTPTFPVIFPPLIGPMLPLPSPLSARTDSTATAASSTSTSESSAPTS